MRKIICPNCRAEYLPAEIYLPDCLLGKPKKIEKDFAGKLVYYEDSSLDMMEEYICDYCGKKLYIKADVSFNIVSSNSSINIAKPNNKYHKLNKNSLF